MEAEKQPIIYSFHAAEELPPDQLRRLIRLAIHYGLDPQFALPISVPEEETEDHYRETYPPTSRSSFLGKEHFWRLGEEIGLDKRTTGKLFGMLIHPLKTRAAWWEEDTIISPASLGLVILDRKDAEMPLPPSALNLNQGGRTDAERLHAKQEGGNLLPPQTAVIQVSGLLDLIQEPEKLKSIARLKGTTLGNLELLATHLNTIIGPE